MRNPAPDRSLPETKRKLLAAACQLMLLKGYTASTVDEIFSEAGVTKGSFFHYFDSKEDLAKAAIDFFSSAQRDWLQSAGLERQPDPVSRLMAYLDFFQKAAEDPRAPKSCLVGNLTQEISKTHPALRERCECNLDSWSSQMAALLQEAKIYQSNTLDFDPRTVADMFFSLAQGSFVLAKARQDPAVIQANLIHFRRYVETLLGVSHSKPPQTEPAHS